METASIQAKVRLFQMSSEKLAAALSRLPADPDLLFSRAKNMER